MFVVFRCTPLLLSHRHDNFGADWSETAAAAVARCRSALGPLLPSGGDGTAVRGAEARFALETTEGGAARTHARARAHA